MATKNTPLPLTQAMVNLAIYSLSSNSLRSVSGVAIKQYILNSFPITNNVTLNYDIRRFLDQGIEDGILIQVSGNGMRGSYRFTETARIVFDGIIRAYIIEANKQSGSEMKTENE